MQKQQEDMQMQQDDMQKQLKDLQTQKTQQIQQILREKALEIENLKKQQQAVKNATVKANTQIKSASKKWGVESQPQKASDQPEERKGQPQQPEETKEGVIQEDYDESAIGINLGTTFCGVARVQMGLTTRRIEGVKCEMIPDEDGDTV